MPEDGLYLWTEFEMDLSHIFGEKFNINYVRLVGKSKKKYFGLVIEGTVQLWDEKE